MGAINQSEKWLGSRWISYIYVCLYRKEGKGSRKKLLTLSLIHEGDKASQSKDKTENKTDGDGDMRDSGEPSMRALLQRIVDQICVVVTDKC